MHSCRFRVLTWLVFGLLLASVCLLHSPEHVFARAGDGGSYGGGSGSGGGNWGSGGSGGGDGGLELLFDLIWLVIQYPKVGVPVTVALVVIVYFSGNSAHSGYVGRTIRKGVAVQDAASQEQAETERQQALSAVCGRDSSFDEGKFLERVSTAFVRIQEGLEPPEPGGSPPLYQRRHSRTLLAAIRNAAGAGDPQPDG